MFIKIVVQQTRCTLSYCSTADTYLWTGTQECGGVKDFECANSPLTWESGKTAQHKKKTKNISLKGFNTKERYKAGKFLTKTVRNMYVCIPNNQKETKYRSECLKLLSAS